MAAADRLTLVSSLVFKISELTRERRLVGSIPMVRRVAANSNLPHFCVHVEIHQYFHEVK